MYKVMIGVWTTIRDDYIIGEYSGIVHNSKADALKELLEATEACKYVDCIQGLYIEEV